jgi:N-acetylglucosaminyl-diphospho-decaprenol L-rhamnosyltransferase
VSDLSVVVVSWNTRELLLECLGALEEALAARGAAAPLRSEILVVDNGSADGSAEAVRECFPDVQLVALDRNAGFAAGANAGLRRAKGRVFLLLNSDARITREAIDRCLACLASEPRAGAAGPELRHGDGRPQRSAHGFPGLATELVPRPLLEWLAPRRFPPRRVAASAPVGVPALRGAVLFVRREVVESVGLLCEDFYFFLEDTEWCLRMGRAGWRIFLVPGAPVVHQLGASSKRAHPARTRIEYHRALYRFLRMRRGPGVAALAALLRVAKALSALALAALAAPVSAAARRGVARRAPVLLWHLRGCPAEAGLAAFAGDRSTGKA